MRINLPIWDKNSGSAPPTSAVQGRYILTCENHNIPGMDTWSKHWDGPLEISGESIRDVTLTYRAHQGVSYWESHATLTMELYLEHGSPILWYAIAGGIIALGLIFGLGWMFTRLQRVVETPAATFIGLTALVLGVGWAITKIRQRGPPQTALAD